MDDSVVITIAQIRSLIESNPEVFMDGYIAGGRWATENPDAELTEVVDGFVPHADDASVDYDDPAFQALDRIHTFGRLAGAVIMRGGGESSKGNT